VIEVAESTFEQDVLQASHQVPVLVDFWAPWCGPCRALGPALERLEQSYAGRFKLAKVNSDQNPELSTRFQVRSIPYVLAFVDGAAVDGFVGALPEGQLRAFIDRVIPDPSERERRRARKLIEREELDAAGDALRAAIGLNPANDEAHLDLAELLLERLPPPFDTARLEEAERELRAVGRAARDQSRWRVLDTRISSLRSSASSPDLDSLRARVASDPADLTARLELAQHYIADRSFELALEQLLEIVRRDRRFGEDVGRRLMLSVFELASDRPQLVSTYRRQLSAAVNR